MADYCDLIIKGHILTMSLSVPYATAVAIKNGRIEAVGVESEIEKLAGEKTVVMDVGGKTVLPGFIDTHLHGVFTGSLVLNVDLSEATCVTDVCDMLKQRAKITPPGEPIIGMNFKDEALKERRAPTLSELDEISTNHPLFVLNYDCHSVKTNVSGFKFLGLSEEAEGVVLNKKGELTGWIEDPAIYSFHELLNPPEKLKVMESVLAASNLALSVGVSTIHMKESPHILKIILSNENELPVRINPLAMITEKSQVEFALKDPIVSERATIAMFADGAPDSKTAAFFEPYVGEPNNYGMLTNSSKDLEEMITAAHLAGNQASVHACGTRAIEQVIRIYEKVLAAYPRNDHRHRIEHFEMPMGDQIKRAADNGIAFSMQPSILYFAGENTLNVAESIVGKEAAGRWHPYRAMLDQGILIAGGSDSPVTRPNPMLCIQACVNHPVEKHRISVYEAIKMVTSDAAKIGFEEKDKGKIEVGKLADFVVLSENPFHTPIDKISTICVEKTIIGGKTMYERS